MKDWIVYFFGQGTDVEFSLFTAAHFAPVVLIVLADRSVGTYVYDGSLVMGNLMLAAHDLGIGSCWIHRAKQEFETDEGKAILADLGVEGEYEGIGHCVLGYPEEGGFRPVAPRKENYVYWIE